MKAVPSRKQVQSLLCIYLVIVHLQTKYTSRCCFIRLVLTPQLLLLPLLVQWLLFQRIRNELVDNNQTTTRRTIVMVYEKSISKSSTTQLDGHIESGLLGYVRKAGTFHLKKLVSIAHVQLRRTEYFPIWTSNTVIILFVTTTATFSTT